MKRLYTEDEFSENVVHTLTLEQEHQLQVYVSDYGRDRAIKQIIFADSVQEELKNYLAIKTLPRLMLLDILVRGVYEVQKTFEELLEDKLQEVNKEMANHIDDTEKYTYYNGARNMIKEIIELHKNHKDEEELEAI
ncbi:hypothetical protein [Bacillus subtilis]|uniref:hypothetical protein n=1 Tax=Bacillus subtilis TaxID=1423 RepID=UPI0025C86568|nr:hypothetical protein [Bacillus subtilis]GLI90453.1 hypothetical protein ANABIO4_38050 [Bacillus subtilis]